MVGTASETLHPASQIDPLIPPLWSQALGKCGRLDSEGIVGRPEVIQKRLRGSSPA